MATPYDAPIPGSPGYADAALSAKTAYQNALARINANRQSTLHSYGYLGDVNPDTGVLSNVRVDPMNQFGGLQSMLRNQALQSRDAAFAAQERGLHGGLANQAQSDLKYQAGAESSQLGTDLTQALGGLQDQQDSAAFTRDQALYQAELDAARLAIEQQAFNPADTSGITDPGYGNDPNAGGVGYTDGGVAAPPPVAQPYVPHVPATLPPMPNPGTNLTQIVNSLPANQNSGTDLTRIINNLLNPPPPPAPSKKKKNTGHGPVVG